MQVAFVHDWLVTFRGGEKVLETLLGLYPEAPLYTLFYDPAAMPASITGRDVRVCRWTDRLKPLRKVLLPLLPRAIESLDLSGFDLIISTSSCVAKGAIQRPGATHVCYLHSPMRYIWDQQEEYLAAVSHLPGARALVRLLTPGLQAWDRASARRVTRYVANSSFVARRAEACWGISGIPVVHPPIAVEKFPPAPKPEGADRYLLAAGALVSYKRFDLAIQACEALGRQLVIAGRGPMEGQLRRMAGRWTRFEIGPDDRRFAALMAGADALLFPGIEDFGMTAIEAMAAGTPVIAFRGGGGCDFIEPGVTGVFFDSQTADALAAAIRDFDPAAFDGKNLTSYAARYGREGFLERMRAEIAGALAGQSPGPKA